MRITYIAESPLPSPAANTHQSVRMATACRHLGHRVVMLAPSRWGLPRLRRRAPIARYYGLRPPYPHLISLPASGRSSQSRLYATSVAAYLRGTNTDLVYGVQVPACARAAVMGHPTVQELHDPVSPDGPGAAAFATLLAAPGFRGLVVITRALETAILADWPRLAGWIHVAPNGAPPMPTDVIPWQLNASAKLRVGYAGHLFPGKGMEVVLALARACPWAEFHVLGGGPAELAQWAPHAQNLANLVLHGQHPPSAVPGFLYAIDVALLPNQQDVRTPAGDKNISAWTSPMKAFEYMAAGRPILASDLPVLRELFTHGETALLCPPDDFAAWTAALTRLADQPELRRRLGRQALATFEQHYTDRARAERILAAFGALAAAQKG